MFLSFISRKKVVLKLIPTILFLCAVLVIVVMWILLFLETYLIFIVSVLGVNGPLVRRSTL